MEPDDRGELLAEIEHLRQRLADSPGVLKRHEEQIAMLTTQLGQATAQRDRLNAAMRSMRDDVARLREEVQQLSVPPNGYGIIVQINDDRTYDVVTNGRKLKVVATPGIDAESLTRGSEVVLNDSMNIIEVRALDRVGDVVTVQDVLDDGVRVVVTTRSDETKIAELADRLRGTIIRPGESFRMDQRALMLLERIAQPDSEYLLLEEVPDTSYDDIGGLDDQIDRIADAVELPFLHRSLFAEFDLQAPKGVLLYGPPGCGKTLIAKAVANSLANKVAVAAGHDKSHSYFFNVKGPELLNKYVGETERHIRRIFERARERSAEGWPVIIFFDEMDSMFRTRGTGVSSDMESTIVPQLLAELDGVERLSNVIVIGATNREDLIDPAILRPGRLDVKIKVERPNADGARTIMMKYLDTDVPVDPEEVTEAGGSQSMAIENMCQRATEAMFATGPENEFLEVSYQNGDKEILHYRDFVSGAMIANIVRRAKKEAIKRVLAGGSKGVRTEDLITATRAEFADNDDLPNTTNPDDWARISGKKGERIVFIRTLKGSHDTEGGPASAGAKAIERSVSGQYL